MKLDRLDLSKLRLSFATALVLMAFGAAAVYFSLDRNAAARAALATAQREQSAAEAELRRLRDAEGDIRQKAALFKLLQQRGIVGDERRLDWVELLDDVRTRLRLLELRYEIAPQRALDAAPAGSLALYASDMRVRLMLLHEEDLLRFLDGLRQSAQALVQAKECKLTRLPAPAPAATGGLPPRLGAECRIDWITVHKVAAK